MRGLRFAFGVTIPVCFITSVGFGDVGDVRATFIPEPAVGQHRCATGLAFDGASLYLNRCSDPNIYRISRVDGQQLDTFDPNIPELPAAMAYDGKRNGLWIGTQWGVDGERFGDCGTEGMPIYFWDFDDGSVQLAFTVSVGLFNEATGQIFLRSCFLNGLTYVENDIAADADDELWLADDRNHNIAVFRPDGEFLVGFDGRAVHATMTNCTGLSIAGESLYMNNDGN